MKDAPGGLKGSGLHHKVPQVGSLVREVPHAAQRGKKKKVAKDPSTKLTQLLFDSYMRTSKGMHMLFPTCGHLPYPGYPTLTVDNMLSIGLHPARLLSVPVPGTEAFASASRYPLNRLPVGLPASVSEHCLPLEPWSPSSAIWLRKLIPVFACLVLPCL